jgi:hypothetical protein
VKIPDITTNEQHMVSQALLERYGKLVPLQLADSELQLDPLSTQLTDCPTLFWSERGADFVICKVGENRYRCQFFYSEHEQFGTGRDVYDDLTECVTTLLQVQADHEQTRQGVPSGADRSKLGENSDDADYAGPLVI